MNAKLFVKRGRSLVLTEAGTRLVEQGDHLLEQALDLETSVQKIANGWEAELGVGLADVVPIAWFLSIVDKLYAVSPHTQVSITREVLTGGRDSLIGGRADIVVGAPYNVPAGRGLATTPMGEIEFVVAVAPQHPIANAPDPLDYAVYSQYRVVVVPDTTRTLQQMTLPGLFPAQAT
ncbi:MAG: DNA-binding transcriptional LysR family regulator [Gammaproteobacteria bacterium]